MGHVWSHKADYHNVEVKDEKGNLLEIPEVLYCVSVFVVLNLQFNIIHLTLFAVSHLFFRDGQKWW